MKVALLAFAVVSCGVLFADGPVAFSEDGVLPGGEIAVDTTYDLAGHTLTLAAPLVVSGGATLTVSDSAGTGILDYAGRKGYAVVVKDGALVLNGGTIRSASGSGAIYLASSSLKPKFTMNGGKVLATSTGTEAAAIFAGLEESDNAVVEINGGEISGLVGIALAGRNDLTVKEGVKVGNVVENSAEPTHWGLAFANGRQLRLDVSADACIGGLDGSLARDSNVQALFGSHLWGGYYSTVPFELAIATGYRVVDAEDDKAEAGYPWKLVKDVSDFTIEFGDEKVDVEIPNSFIEEYKAANPGATDDDVRNFLLATDERTGIANWQRAQLGLGVKGELAVSAIDGENGGVSAHVALGRVNTIKSNGKLEITYSLFDAENEEMALSTSPDPVFDVDLGALSSGNPVKEWVVKANFIARTNDEEKAICVTHSVESVNCVGAVRVDNPGSSVLLATPWVQVSEDGTKADAIPVKDMVDTVTLSPGDELNVYNTDGSYLVFQLDGNREWRGVDMVDPKTGGIVTPDPNTPVEPGQAVWLNRTGDTTKPVYLLGQVEPQDSTFIKPAQADAEKKVATILGNPHPEATVIPADVKTQGDVSKDEILVVDGEVFRRYVRNEAGQLGYYQTVERKIGGNTFSKTQFVPVDEVTIPPGEAFWYQSKGGTIEIPVGGAEK